MQKYASIENSCKHASFKWKSPLLLFCASLFFVSAFMPAWTSRGTMVTYGAEIMATGFLGITSSAFSFCWFANISLIASWLLIWNNKFKDAFPSVVFSLALATIFSLCDEICDNAGGLSFEIKLEYGYYVWLSSFWLTALTLGITTHLHSVRDGLIKA